MGTTIIIPTYFGGQMVTNCVASILKNVENPKILIYKNDIGWLAACNEAVNTITDDIILLNDDTLVLTDIVKAMSSLAYSDPAIAIVGGKSLAPNTETIVNYGIQIFPDGNSAHRYFGQRRDSVKVETQKAVEGSCMFIKREAIFELELPTDDLFDTGFGKGYREEVDLCFRARENGWKVMSTPDAEYVHFQNQTNGKLGVTNDTFDYFNEKWGAKLKLGQI